MKPEELYACTKSFFCLSGDRPIVVHEDELILVLTDELPYDPLRGRNGVLYRVEIVFITPPNDYVIKVEERGSEWPWP